MATVPIQTSVQKASPGDLVDLMKIDLQRLGGSVLYFTPQVYEDQTPLAFGGIAYAPVPMEVTGFERSGKGPFARPHVVIGNVNLEGSALVYEFRDLVGATVTHIQTYARHLDDGEDPDDEIWLQKNVFRVARKVRQHELMIEWELSASIDQQGRKFPGRQVTRSCPLIYRNFDQDLSQFFYATTQRRCPYEGDNCFDRNGNPVAASLDDCSHDDEGCKLRFGQYAELPYGGFLGAGLSR